MVKLEDLDSNDTPFVINQPEFMRRMKEMSANGGGGMFAMEARSVSRSGKQQFFSWCYYESWRWTHKRSSHQQALWFSTTFYKVS